MRFYALLFLLLANLAAKELPPELDRIVDPAAKAPPEYGAAALLDVAARLPAKEKLPYLVRAFELAASGSPQVGVERQAEAVLALVPLDPALARELFGRIHPKSPGPLSCTADSVPPESYGLAIRLVSERTFTPEERLKGDHVRLLVEYLATVTAPQQIQPSVVGLTAEELAEVAYAVAGALGRLQTDDRTFTLTLKKLSNEVQALHASLSGSARVELAAAWRKYLVNHLKGKRCSSASPEEIEVIQTYNSSLVTEDSRTQPIAKEETDGERMDKAEDPNAKDVQKWSERFRSLMFANGGGLPRSTDQKQTVVWQREFDAMVAEVEGTRRNDGESESSFLLRKANGYRVLAFAAAEDRKAALIQDFAAFLAGSPVRTEDPALWTKVVASSYSIDAVRFREAFERSGDPLLLLQSALLSLPPRPAI